MALGMSCASTRRPLSIPEAAEPYHLVPNQNRCSDRDERSWVLFDRRNGQKKKIGQKKTGPWSEEPESCSRNDAFRWAYKQANDIFSSACDIKKIKRVLSPTKHIAQPCSVRRSDLWGGKTSRLIYFSGKASIARKSPLS